jgi:hypothetical protein
MQVNVWVTRAWVVRAVKPALIRIKWTLTMPAGGKPDSAVPRVVQKVPLLRSSENPCKSLSQPYRAGLSLAGRPSGPKEQMSYVLRFSQAGTHEPWFSRRSFGR